MFETLGYDHWRALAAEKLEAAFPGIDPWTLPAPGENPANDGAVIASVLGEMCAAEEARLPALLDQAFSDTADGIYLERIARKYGITRGAARPASGDVDVSGASASGVIAAGTALFGPGGQRYESVSDVAADANGDAVLRVIADESGPRGNLGAGAPLTAVGLSAAVSSGGLAGGAVTEDDDGLRARVRLRELNPGGYGRLSDYAGWALEVPGVSRAWVWGARVMGAGNVAVAIASDEGGTAPTPSQELIDQARAHIESRKPAEAGLRVFGPIPKTVDVTIPDLLPDTADVRAAVVLALRETLFDIAVPASPAGGGSLSGSWLVQAIANAPGEISHGPVLPDADVPLGAFEIPVLGDVRFV